MTEGSEFSSVTPLTKEMLEDILDGLPPLTKQQRYMVMLKADPVRYADYLKRNAERMRRKRGNSTPEQ